MMEVHCNSTKTKGFADLQSLLGDVATPRWNPTESIDKAVYVFIGKIAKTS